MLRRVSAWSLPLRRQGVTIPRTSRTGTLPADRQQELDCLAAEYEGLIEEHGGDPKSKIAAQLEALSEKIENLAEGANLSTD
jgi:hypothetical protein